MLLGDYFHNIKKDYKKFFFSGISFNSNEIVKNNIFFAIRGNKIDGTNFISHAIKNGSKIIISEHKNEGLKDDILYIKTKNIRKLLAEISFKIYNKIPKNIIAVTGTNGKSSVADFYYQILKLNKKRVASIFPTSNPQYVFIVMLDTPQKAKDYYYKYRHQKGGWKGTLYNTAGWTSVEVAGKIIDKIGPILATKYLEIN